MMSIIAVSAFPVCAAEKRVRPFKTFKIGKVSFKSELNKEFVLNNKNKRAYVRDHSINVSDKKVNKIKKGNRLKVKLKKGYKATISMDYYTKNWDDMPTQKLKNGKALKAGWNNIICIMITVKKGKKWSGTYFLTNHGNTEME